MQEGETVGIVYISLTRLVSCIDDEGKFFQHLYQHKNTTKPTMHNFLTEFHLIITFRIIMQYRCKGLCCVGKTGADVTKLTQYQVRESNSYQVRQNKNSEGKRIETSIWIEFIQPLSSAVE